MIAKIVSHLPPRHMDDWIALSLLKFSFPRAEIQYMQEQNLPEEYLKDKKVVLVDIGSRYEPENNNYDHHQSTALPCSLVLVLKHFYPEVPESVVIKAIDIADRFGIEEVYKRGLAEEDKEVEELSKIILKTEPSGDAGNTVYRLLSHASLARTDYNTFIRMLYTSLKVQSLVEEVHNT